MPIATLPAPEPSLASERCANCGRLVVYLSRGRCAACYDYWRRYNQERPERLWRRPAAVWREVTPGENGAGPWCECGQPVAWLVSVPISETARARLALCQKCAELERRLSPGSNWGD